MSKHILAFALTLALCGAFAFPAGSQEEEPGVGLTVYSNADPRTFDPNQFMSQPAFQRRGMQLPGFGIVRNVREIMLEEGTNEVRWDEVAAAIDPTTVSIVSLTDPDGTSVLEQNFEFDLVSATKIYEKYLGEMISLTPKEGDPISGRLLSYSEGYLVLETDDPKNPIVMLMQGEVKKTKLSSLPGGLITKPTLVWLLHAEKGGEHRTKVTYQTDSITWRADYIFVLNQEDTEADVNAWVTLVNKSGATYPDAKLKLIAGDVQRIQPQPQVQARLYATLEKAAAAPAGFEEKAFFEYHLYTLGRQTTIKDNSTKQIELFDPVMGADVKKVLVYYGQEGVQYGFFPNPRIDRNYGVTSNTKVDIYIEMENEKENGLGIPLPAGRIRTYKKDPADGSLEFIGEDAIDHTPKDETVRIRLGQAFDVVGERKQTDFQVDSHRDWLDETIEIKIRNHKEERADVIVKENLYRWINWKIVESSHDFEKVDSRTIHFPVTVEPDGEVVITYKVHYSW
jgi:hypothetical protein